MFCHCSVKGLKFKYSAETWFSFARDIKCGEVSLLLWLSLLFLVYWVEREELQSLDIGDIHGRCFLII